MKIPNHRKRKVKGKKSKLEASEVSGSFRQTHVTKLFTTLKDTPLLDSSQSGRLIEPNGVERATTHTPLNLSRAST